jgi:hypothetical protein
LNLKLFEIQTNRKDSVVYERENCGTNG